MSGAGGRGELTAAAERLEEVARRLADPDASMDELAALAQEALDLGGRITESLPRALRPGPDGEGGDAA